MELESAFLANRAEKQGGLLYVMGGYPEWWSVPKLPFNSTLYCVAVVRLDASEALQEFTCSVVYKNKRVISVSSVRGVTDQDVPGAPMVNVIPFSFDFEFRETGLHEFTIVRDDRATMSREVYESPPTGPVLASMPLWVRLITFID